jgi:hypothetical protein
MQRLKAEDNQDDAADQQRGTEGFYHRKSLSAQCRVHAAPLREESVAGPSPPVAC